MSDSTIAVEFMVVSAGVLMSALFLLVMVVLTTTKNKHTERYKAEAEANREATEQFFALFDTKEII